MKIFYSVLLIVLVASVVFALPSDMAREKSKAIDDEGNVIGPKDLDSVYFIRYVPKFAKKPCDGDGACESDEGKWCRDCKAGDDPVDPEPTCYGFLGGGKPRWQTPEDYYYSHADLGAAAMQSVNILESAVSGDIFGAAIPGTWPWATYDNHNAVTYGDYSDPNVLGVTRIWFRGKKIYEYDIMLDTDYFPNGGYDLETVMLHELAHGAGLDDLYDSVCTTELMYYLYQGPRLTLGDGDKAGLAILYG